MIDIKDDGKIEFEIKFDDAQCVEVIGAFDGWEEQSRAMKLDHEGIWRLNFDPGPGTFLFRYRVDGETWHLDDEAHGSAVSQDGILKSRVYRPGFEYLLAYSAA